MALRLHVTPAPLRDSFAQLNQNAAAGVDGLRWRKYERDFDEQVGKL
jgi:hypothetical protein